MIINKIIRPPLLFLFNFYLRLRGGNIHSTARVSLKTNLDFTSPRGIYIDEGSYIAFGATTLAHDFVRSMLTDTRIGKKTFIGVNSIILPGVIVGNGSIVAGNSAQVIHSDVRIGSFGQLVHGRK